MKADDLDKQFDDGESILDHVDVSKAKRINQEQKRVNVDSPSGCLNPWTRKPDAWVFHDRRSSKSGFPNGWTMYPLNTIIETWNR